MNFEDALIANALFDAESCEYAFTHVQAEHFQDKINAKIWEAIRSVLKASKIPDVLMVTEELKNDSVASDRLMELYADSHTATTAKQNADMVLDKWNLTKCGFTLGKILDEIKLGQKTVKDLKNDIESLALTLSERSKEKGLVHVSKISEIVVKQMRDISEGKFPGVQFGFRDIDNMRYFLRNGTLNYLAARPAMGKSAFALSVAKRCGKNVALYTLEMGSDEQYQRLLSPEVYMSNSDFYDKRTLDSKLNKIDAGIKKVNNYKIWMDDDAKITTSTIYHQCKRMQSSHGLGLIVIDYTGLIKSLEKNKNRQEIMGIISLELKAIASDLSLPILSLAQLNRDCEKREDKRPMLSDLRESGGLEQDAHMVMSIYRDEVYNAEGEKGKAELIFLKNRGGKTGVVPLKFNGFITDFSDWSEDANFIPQ